MNSKTGALIMMVMSLGACGKLLGRKKKSGPAATLVRHYYYGDLKDAHEEMMAADSITDSCDRQDDPLISNILDKLEQHHSEIEAYKVNSRQADDSLDDGEALEEKVTLGAKFSLKKTKMLRPLKTEWEKSSHLTYKYLWDYIETHPDMPAISWTSIEEIVRSNFSSDHNRRSEGQNAYTHHLQWNLMSDLQKTLSDCRAEENCGLEQWKNKYLTSEILRKHVEVNPFTQFFVNEMANKSISEQRVVLKSFEDYVKMNIKWKSAEASSNIVHEKRGASDVYVVNVTSDIQDQISRDYAKKQLESFWNNKNIVSTFTGEYSKVEVNWVENNALPGPFNVIFHMDVGRAFVDQSAKTLNLFIGDSVSVMLHEFGHVLGLPDRYYEFRNLETCTVDVESLETDMMSANKPGSQWLDSDWKDFAQLYPVKK